MKNINDYIDVYIEKNIIKGVIKKISFDYVTVLINDKTFNFDTICGESEEGYSIDLTELIIPENHFNFIKNKINNEGFHYCFNGYSDWSEVQDEEFQKLKENYLDAAKKLENYIDEKSNLF